MQGTVESILARISGDEYQKALDPTITTYKQLEDLADSYKISYQQNKMVSRYRCLYSWALNVYVLAFSFNR